MPNEKANKEVEKIQYLNRHCNTNENSEKAKSERLPKRISGQLRLPLAFIFSKLKSFLRVLVWRSEATPLVYDKHTPNCHSIHIIPSAYSLAQALFYRHKLLHFL